MTEPSAPPLQDKSAPFSHQEQPANTADYSARLYPEPPPPYTPNDPGLPPGPSSPPTQVYAAQPLIPVVPAPPVVVPVQQAAAPNPQPTQVVVVVDHKALPPGACTVCRVSQSTTLFVLLFYTRKVEKNGGDCR